MAGPGALPCALPPERSRRSSEGKSSSRSASAEREDGTPLPPEVAARARVGVPLLSTAAAQAAQQEHERLQALLDRFDQCTMEDRRAAVFSGTGDCALPDRTDVLACVRWAGAWPLGGWTLDGCSPIRGVGKTSPLHATCDCALTNGTLSVGVGVVGGGCDAVPLSGKTVDECGVCGGDSLSCAGCDGVPWSGLVDDACFVCAGDMGCGEFFIPPIRRHIFILRTYTLIGVCLGLSSVTSAV